MVAASSRMMDEVSANVMGSCPEGVQEQSCFPLEGEGMVDFH